MGSGGLVVMDENTCSMVEVVVFYELYPEERRGKMFPAGEGSNMLRFLGGLAAEKENVRSG